MMTVGEKAEFQTNKGENKITWPARLTVEMVLYVGIGLLAALMRLWALDAWPLIAGEGMQAFGAWNLAHGMAVGVRDYSPILMTGNLLLFGLFKATDATARIWPAIFGTLLALTPALLRHRLGRAGALFAALLLALSPTLMFASRMLDGNIIAVTAGLWLIASIVRLFDTGERRNLILFAAALAIGLLSSPMFYTILTLLITGALALWLLRKPLELDFDARRAGEIWRETRKDTPLWSTLGGILAALLLLLGTGFFFNMDGLGAAADMFPAWLHWFAWGAGSLSPAVTLWSLGVYEMLSLLFGIAGLVIGWKRHDPFVLLLGWWAMTGLILSLAAGGWQPADLILLAAPLALLAGKMLGELLESTLREPLIDGEWTVLILFGLLAVFEFINFAQYGESGKQLFMIISVVLVPIVFLIVAALMVVWIGWRRTLRAVGISLALLLFAIMISTTWSSNHNSDPARYDLLSMNRTEFGIRDLVDTIERYSSQQMKDGHVVPILVVGKELRDLQWGLRDFQEVSYVDLFDEGGPYKIILSPLGTEPALGETYSGQDIAIWSTWQPARLKGQALAKWLAFRDPPTPATRTNVILWAPREETESQ